MNGWSQTLSYPLSISPINAQSFFIVAIIILSSSLLHWILLAYYPVHEARFKQGIQKISYQKDFSWKLDKCDKYCKCKLVLIGYICTVLQRMVCFNLSNQWFPVTATSSITQKGSLKGCSSIIELCLQVKVLFVQITFTFVIWTASKRNRLSK